MDPAAAWSPAWPGLRMGLSASTDRSGRRHLRAGAAVGPRSWPRSSRPLSAGRPCSAGRRRTMAAWAPPRPDKTPPRMARARPDGSALGANRPIIEPFARCPRPAGRQGGGAAVEVHPRRPWSLEAPAAVGPGDRVRPARVIERLRVPLVGTGPSSAARAAGSRPRPSPVQPRACHRRGRHGRPAAGRRRVPRGPRTRGPGQRHPGPRRLQPLPQTMRTPLPELSPPASPTRQRAIRQGPQP